MTLRCHGPGLYGWGRFQKLWGYDFNGTALVSAEGVVITDPIAPTDAELEALRALGQPVDVVLLNADHARASAEVAAALGAPVWIPAADHALLTQPDLRTYGAGHVFRGGWVAHAIPHHKTPGEMVLHHPGRGVLVVGDAVIGDPVTGLRFVPAKKLPDRDAARAALRPLLALDFDALLLGDGFVLPQGGHAALTRFVEGAG